MEDKKMKLTTTTQTTTSKPNGKKETIKGAYNKFVEKQNTGFGNNTFALTTFTQKGEITPLVEVQKLRLKDYACCGGTPLYKTISSTIKDIDLTLNNPIDVVMIIITDGMDTHGGLEEARGLIEQKLDLGWQFVYCSPSR